MNEDETRTGLIEPSLKSSGWGTVEGSKILREYPITGGKLQAGGARSTPLTADYILVYKGNKVAVIEAMSDKIAASEGVSKAKRFASMLNINFTYATNGKDIYEINVKSGREGLVRFFPSPSELTNKIHQDKNDWRDAFNAVPFEDVGGSKYGRYYQELAVNKTMVAIADNKNRILLNLASGTGKTFVAFQIVWKLFQSRWSLSHDGARRPRILYLASRAAAANQAYNAFSSFSDDERELLMPGDILKGEKAQSTARIFFAIPQIFINGTDKDEKSVPFFGEYSKDFFDCIIIDECHPGDISRYFSTAVQIGFTAIPKRKENADTYKYFGDPIYAYSMKEGIDDGFLTPYKIRRLHSTIEERDAERVRKVMVEIKQNDKTVFFCESQAHAAIVRDLVSEYKNGSEPDRFVCIAAGDNEIEEQDIRNLVLMCPVNSMIEFKQIAGRGTRLFEGKDYFTIYDFVDAYHHFFDPEWDGDPLEIDPCKVCGNDPCTCKKTKKLNAKILT